MIRNPFPAGTRAHELLKRLFDGPIAASEIHSELRILNHNEVLSQVRRAVREQGGDILSTPVNRRRTHYIHRLIQPGQQTLFTAPAPLRHDSAEGGRRWHG